MKSETFSWEQIESLSQILSKKINALGQKFNSISTISRGGLVPARLLADRLGINKILVDKNNIPSDSLFVDDIYDSGDTFKKILSIVENPETLVYATLFARKGKQYPKQLIFAQRTKGNEYIVYPWDRIEHKKMIN
ncbi:MAG TPA: phosphoribosyltransferase [Nitrosopumilaceae archaeon]|nr:phosphoribosyltransferase [Nitrosopumilaceae archaeon]